MKKKNKGLPPRGEPKRVLVSNLRLDPQNPRLPESEDAQTDDDLVAQLAADYSLSELGLSLADNGFFEEEPLAVLREKESGKEVFKVVEGNRRTAALKLLTNSGLRSRLGLNDWNELAARAKYDLSMVPVIVYRNRTDLLSFMGFRHITGVKPWEPLAKARFVHSLIEDHGLSFQDAARCVGSKANAIKLTYLTHQVYLQARDNLAVDTSKLESVYGVFTRAMSSAPIKDHIGISTVRESSNDPKKLRNPVPKSKQENLRELMGWIAGTEKAGPVINDSRQLTTLGEVVASDAALETLRAGRSLEVARQLTAGEEQRISQNLTKASFHLDEALKDAHRHKKSDRIRMLFKRCEETVQEIRKALI